MRIFSAKKTEKHHLYNKTKLRRYRKNRYYIQYYSWSGEKNLSAGVYIHV